MCKANDHVMLVLIYVHHKTRWLDGPPGALEQPGQALAGPQDSHHLASRGGERPAGSGHGRCALPGTTATGTTGGSQAVKWAGLHGALEKGGVFVIKTIYCEC